MLGVENELGGSTDVRTQGYFQVYSPVPAETTTLSGEVCGHAVPGGSTDGVNTE